MKPQSALPRIHLEINGTRLPAEKLRTLAGIRVAQKLSVPSQCEISFEEFDQPDTSAPGIMPGDEVVLSLDQDAGALFSGEVTAIEYGYGPNGGSERRVRAYDKLHRLRKRQPVRTHVQVTFEDLASEIIGAAGLSVTGHVSGPVWDRVFQYRQSDLDLLVELAERIGAYIVNRGDTCHLLTLEGTGEAVPLKLGDSLLEARVEVNGDSSCRAVKAIGWDPSTVRKYEGHASSPRNGRSVAAEVPPASVGGTGEWNLMDEPAPNASHADAIAQAELDRRIGREVTLWGIGEGDRRLQPGTRIDVAGLDLSVCGRYVLTAVSHRITRETGFISEISTVPPPVRARARNAATAPGVVTRVDDPEGRARVQVRMPTYGDLETGWINVIMAGAGGKKGMIAVPDVNDQVLILFAQEDPGRAIVLGGLYGEEGAAPDSGVEGGAVRRFSLMTPGGQRLTLNDTRQSIRFEDQKGSFVELAPDQVTIHSKVGLTLEAPGQAVVFKGKTIDFERA